MHQADIKISGRLRVAMLLPAVCHPSSTAHQTLMKFKKKKNQPLRSPHHPGITGNFHVSLPPLSLAIHKNDFHSGPPSKWAGYTPAQKVTWRAAYGCQRWTRFGGSGDNATVSVSIDLRIPSPGLGAPNKWSSLQLHSSKYNPVVWRIVGRADI